VEEKPVVIPTPTHVWVLAGQRGWVENSKAHGMKEWNCVLRRRNVVSSILLHGWFMAALKGCWHHGWVVPLSTYVTGCQRVAKQSSSLSWPITCVLATAVVNHKASSSSSLGGTTSPVVINSAVSAAQPAQPAAQPGIHQ
jgi:hypothetical protein